MKHYWWNNFPLGLFVAVFLDTFSEFMGWTYAGIDGRVSGPWDVAISGGLLAAGIVFYFRTNRTDKPDGDE